MKPTKRMRNRTEIKQAVNTTPIRCETCFRHVPLYHVEIGGAAVGTAVYDALHCRDCIDRKAVRGMKR